MSATFSLASGPVDLAPVSPRRASGGSRAAKWAQDPNPDRGHAAHMTPQEREDMSDAWGAVRWRVEPTAAEWRAKREALADRRAARQGRELERSEERVAHGFILPRNLTAPRSVVLSGGLVDLEIWEGAKLWKVRLPGASKEAPPRSVQRGFSAASRRAMMDTVNRVRADVLPLFITLSFPRPVSCEAAKKAFQVFEKRLRRAHPEAAMIWRLEIQPTRWVQRGEYAPHFHCLLYGVPWLPVRWLEDAWQASNGQPNPSRNSADIEAIRGAGGVAFYCAKYCAKVSDEKELASMPETTGRVWGVTNRKAMPWGRKVVIPIEIKSARFLAMAATDALGIRGSEPLALATKFYCNEPERLLNVIDDQRVLIAPFYITCMSRWQCCKREVNKNDGNGSENHGGGVAGKVARHCFGVGKASGGGGRYRVRGPRLPGQVAVPSGMGGGFGGRSAETERRYARLGACVPIGFGEPWAEGFDS